MGTDIAFVGMTCYTRPSVLTPMVVMSGTGSISLSSYLLSSLYLSPIGVVCRTG